MAGKGRDQICHRRSLKRFVTKPNKSPIHSSGEHLLLHRHLKNQEIPQGNCLTGDSEVAGLELPQLVPAPITGTKTSRERPPPLRLVKGGPQSLRLRHTDSQSPQHYRADHLPYNFLANWLSPTILVGELAAHPRLKSNLIFYLPFANLLK